MVHLWVRGNCNPGGGSPILGLYTCVAPKGVVFKLFGLKLGINFRRNFS